MHDFHVALDYCIDTIILLGICIIILHCVSVALFGSHSTYMSVAGDQRMYNAGATY